ncbi:MAG: stage 0 sporulation family protein [Chloroflexi bacterium]|nr:stage 0 sporulation family protein [Chloroflexota bacterium]MDA0244618.1 regulatory iron-sulfur-containing complex subunit RicT [Chloroflexota bacterium]
MNQTETTAVSSVIGVRLQKLGKIYHFEAIGHPVVPGDHVLVETRRGVQLGQVIRFVEPDEVFQARGLKAIQRKATPRDMVLRQVWQDKELNTLITCREQASRMNIKGDIKFVKAEYNYDGSWLTIMYTTENKKLNLEPLRREMMRLMNAQVEMQLIGPRDVAKIIGGYGACGGPRCCSTFLTEFSPVSIKMAKEQGISLSPSEITGVCGRLRCCLVYEYEQYVAAKKALPKRGKIIGTPHGEGVVRDVRPLKESVIVEVDEKIYELTLAELEPVEELRALEAKAKAGCSKHEGGGCDCGAK